MEIMVERRLFTEESTTGELSVDGAFECYTLEDVVRAKKVAGRTAIRSGRYEIAVCYSNKFKTLLPLLIDVPNFQGVRVDRSRPWHG